MSAVLFPPSKRSLFTSIRAKQMVKLFSVTESSLLYVSLPVHLGITLANDKIDAHILIHLF